MRVLWFLAFSTWWRRHLDQIIPSGFPIACRISTGQLLLFGRRTRQCLEIRNRGLLFHCYSLNTFKYAHFWNNARLILLITAVFLRVSHGVVLWTVQLGLCRVSQINSDPPRLSFSKCLSNVLVWEKTQINQKSFFCCLWEGEEWGGEERTKRGESKVGSGGIQTQGPYQVEEAAAAAEESSKRGTTEQRRRREILICLNRVLVWSQTQTGRQGSYGE